jgi:mono/diheme cytochrome c family protein
MDVWKTLFLVPAHCGIAALAVLAAAETPPGADRGRGIFEQRCAVCHGQEGRGDGAQAPFLSPRPASLISAGTSAKSDQDLLKVIANGKPRTAMSGWKDVLSEEEQREVLRYIRTLVRFHRPLTPPPPTTNP